MDPSIPDDKLTDVVLGRDRTASRSEALTELAASDRPDREQLLAAVLENTYEPRRYRTEAAIALGRVPTPAAEQILHRNAANTGDEIFPDVLRSLGRIGGRPALRAIDSLKLPPGHVGADAAAFAATLIAHRLGIPGYELPFPAEQELLPRPVKESRPIEYGPANPAAAQAVSEALRRYPYGIDCDPASFTRLECAGQVTMVCPNREFAGLEVGRRAGRPAVLALVALQSPETGEYSVSHVVLSRPAGRGSAALTVHRSSGKMLMAGSARVRGARLEFELRAVRRPGARAVSLVGTMQGRRVQLREAVASTSQEPPRAAGRYVPPSGRPPFPIPATSR